MTRRRKLKGILLPLLLGILTVSFLYPLYYMLINSLKTRTDFFTNQFNLPHAPLQFVNYTTMISQFKILNLFKNSFIISACTVVGLLIIGTFASYVFAKYRFKGRSVIYVAVLATMFIPSQVTIIPLYVLFSKIGLVSTYWSVVFAYLALFLPECILLMTANFRSIIDELLEAAEIDGCSYLQKVGNVVIPMGRAAIFLSIIFYFIMSWNDLFTPMIFLQSMEKRTVMVALAALMGRYTGAPTLQFAGLLLSAVPALIVYIVFQKNIIKGLSLGAIK
ncbi:MAG: carbohydrate ABC transporter permease [Spirochaetaceae bacterium]|nr:MAG: carbohydrate ABC transporter permease [Spirochaetaceae bacterium]